MVARPYSDPIERNDGGHRVKASLAALALTCLTSGCASSQSCPAVFLGPIVHVDASAWVADNQLTPAPGLKATICVGETCVAAAAITKANPNDVAAGASLSSGMVTVRVKLTAPDGRSLDQTTTAEVTLAKPFGSGCGGRDEVDLTVTKAGTLMAGQTAKTN